MSATVASMRHRVGIGLASGWTWRWILDQLGFLDVNFEGMLTRVFGIYIPHGGYDDQHVDLVYAQLGACITNTNSPPKHSIFTGDFNADIGIRHANDSHEAYHDSNQRHIYLRLCCSLFDLHIANEAVIGDEDAR